jgi:tetratricopeptide (TPR) repeat protein
VRHFAQAETSARAAGTNQLSGYFYFEAGAACERNGEFERATEYFEKSLKLAPDLPEALNYYGYMLADRGLKLDKARVMIERAVHLEPNNAAYIDSLGWVLFKLGKLQDGLFQEQKAIELSGEEPDPTLFDHLGDIYAALKQPDKAREAWKKSLSLEPSEEVRKKIGPAQ